MNELRSFIVFILLLIVLLPGRLTAQETDSLEQDSLVVSDTLLKVPEVKVQEIAQAVDTTARPLQVKFKPNPTRAVIYSAICPGLGQIYNRKYWKLPLVYGGLLGCVYAITWNGNQYNSYKQAYTDFTDDNPNTNSWENYRPYSWGPDPDTWSSKDKSDFTSMLKNGKDYYRRYRDLSYIITAGVYVLCMIDAYVDAQLFDFDISPDLSMRMEPVIFPRTSTGSRSVGLQCSFSF